VLLLFCLDAKINKKDQSAAADEILDVNLKSRNSRVECFSFKIMPPPRRIDFLTADVSHF